MHQNIVALSSAGEFNQYREVVVHLLPGLHIDPHLLRIAFIVKSGFNGSETVLPDTYVAQAFYLGESFRPDAQCRVPRSDSTELEVIADGLHINDGLVRDLEFNLHPVAFTRDECDLDCRILMVVQADVPVSEYCGRNHIGCLKDTVMQFFRDRLSGRFHEGEPKDSESVQTDRIGLYAYRFVSKRTEDSRGQQFITEIDSVSVVPGSDTHKRV